MRITTFNIGPNGNWDGRKSIVGGTIKEIDPDVLYLQEPKMDQLEDILSEIGWEDWYGETREDKPWAEANPILFPITQRYTDSGTFWLSEDPNVAESQNWDTDFPRIVTWVISEETLFINTHFSHVSYKARSESPKIIGEQLGEKIDAYPTILGGDLNCGSSAAPHSKLESLGLRDASDVADKTSGPERTYHDWTGRGKHNLDYLYVTDDVDVKHHEVFNRDVGSWPSDHFPVTIEV